MKETIYLGAGCFWGVEELLRRLEGVESSVSGYMGGSLENPTYQDICTGRTGHAEVVKVQFDSEVIVLKNLLKYFFKLHDPTTMNRQGVDIGTQYRSVIYCTSEDQKVIADEMIDKINQLNLYKSPIVTEVILGDDIFYKAEDYHQEYYLKKYQGADGPLCHFVRDIDLDSI